MGQTTYHLDFLDKKECKHERVVPRWDDSYFEGLSAEQVRKRFPRFDGVCPDCGVRWILYSSSRHFLAGDW